MLPKQMEQNILKSLDGENAQSMKEEKENKAVNPSLPLITSSF